MCTTILITGANSGVGFATASVLASASKDNHIVMAGRNALKIQAAVEKLSATKPVGRVSSLVLDINDSTSISTATEKIAASHGSLDVLINNAAIYDGTTPLEQNLAEAFRTNVTGQVLMTQAFTPLLLKSSNPYILYVTSGLGSLTMSSPGGSQHGQFDSIPYRTTKAALNMVAVEHARVLGKQGIKVFAICPGLVESNLRGKSMEQVTYHGLAKQASTSGEFVKTIVAGERDGDVGKFIHAGGVYPW